MALSMKTYEEMAASVFRRRDEYFERRAQVQRLWQSRLTKIGAMAAVAVFAVGIVSITALIGAKIQTGPDGAAPMSPGGAYSTELTAGNSPSYEGDTEGAIPSNGDIPDGDGAVDGMPPVDTTDGITGDPAGYLIHATVTREEASEWFGAEIAECDDTEFTGYSVSLVSPDREINSDAICIDMSYIFTDGSVFVTKWDENFYINIVFESSAEYEEYEFQIGYYIIPEYRRIIMFDEHDGVKYEYIADFNYRSDEEIFELLLSLRVR